MTTLLLEPPAVTGGVRPVVSSLVVEAGRVMARAAAVSVTGVSDADLAGSIGDLARLESRAAALRLRLSAEADRRRVAEDTGDTGTDAWLARLTGSPRELMAGGLRIAGLQDTYSVTREAFAAGDLRVEQVRVIVNAAEQAPAEATRAQVRAAEEWLVAQATGAGTRSGRGLDAKRLRQAARRMFAHLDHDLAGSPAPPSTRPTSPCTTAVTAPTPDGSASPSSTATS